jgi:FkbM family methyltransferase
MQEMRLDSSLESRSSEYPVRPAAPLWVRMASSVIRSLPAGRYRAIAGLSSFCPPPFLMPLPSESGRYRFVCDLRDSICRDVCFTGKYEPQETVLVRRLLRPGMVFLDVGANWGYFTLLGAHVVGSTGRVISFEPHPLLYEMLSQNVAQNNLTQVIPLRIGAAAEAGTETLVGWDPATDNWGVSSLIAVAGRPGPEYKIETRAIDNLAGQQIPGAVDLVKMDIEGAEGAALDGMMKGLAQGRYKRLLLELHPEQLTRQGRNPRDILNLLRECGYTIMKIDHSQRATRAAAYSQFHNSAELLSAFSATDSLDSWPHLLCLAPDVTV